MKHYIPLLIRRIAFSFVLLVVAISAYSQECIPAPDVPDKPMMLFFRFDKAIVDSGYMDNKYTLRHLDELLTDSSLYSRIDSINILSFSSTEGNRIYNERLAWKRSHAVKGYLVWKYPYIDQYRIHLRPQGENWKGLRQLIEADPNVPNRDKVLQIIDHTPSSDRCKELLKQLNGGAPYRYIRDHFQRSLRNASICMVWLKQDAKSTLTISTLSPTESKVENDAILQQDSLSALHVNSHSHTKSTNTGETATTGSSENDDFQSEAPITHRPLFALKTNLLFDLALMPNIEVELPIGNRYSINGELMFPWWLMNDHKYCLQILMGGLEGRYWLGSSQSREKREVLTGHFVGLYAGGGKYDLQWDRNGYQGEFFIAAGISYGYSHKIARNLRLEYNIGIGLLRTSYEHYHALDNYRTLLWQNDGRYTWLGPTKLKVSLVWMLNRKVKGQKGGMK